MKVFAVTTMKANNTPIIKFRVIQYGRIIGIYGQLSSARRAARNCYASKEHPVYIDKETTDPTTGKSIYNEIKTITE